MKRVILAFGMAALALAAFADEKPAAFGVKVKNGSWDAWNKKMQIASKQRPSITWRKFKTVQPGLELLGRYRTKTTQEIAGVKHPFDDREVVRTFGEA